MIKKWYFYKFSDGYFCYTGKMTRSEIRWEERTHGKLLIEQPVSNAN